MFLAKKAHLILNYTKKKYLNWTHALCFYILDILFRLIFAVLLTGCLFSESESILLTKYIDKHKESQVIGIDFDIITYSAENRFTMRCEYGHITS